MDSYFAVVDRFDHRLGAAKLFYFLVDITIEGELAKGGTMFGTTYV